MSNTVWLDDFQASNAGLRCQTAEQRSKWSVPYIDVDLVSESLACCRICSGWQSAQMTQSTARQRSVVGKRFRAPWRDQVLEVGPALPRPDSRMKRTLDSDAGNALHISMTRPSTAVWLRKRLNGPPRRSLIQSHNYPVQLGEASTASNMAWQSHVIQASERQISDNYMRL